MKKRKYCDPKDMILYLLALCCQDDSDTPVSRDDILDKRFEGCLEKTIPIANSDELWRRLDEYKSSSSVHESRMYSPLARALNYALECLSDIQVDGLPGFMTHIVFVPYKKEIPSNCDMPGSSFKPDIAVMDIRDARKLHGLDQFDAPEISQFIDEISEKTPSDFSWKTILSAVGVERRKDRSSWAPLEVFDLQNRQASVIRDADQQPDEKLDDSRLTTRVSSATLVSSKRSASATRVEVSAETSGSKRQCTQKGPVEVITQTLANKNGRYAAEKFSGSFSIGNVVSLLVEDDCLWICWVDREGVIFSSGFSFFKNLPLALVLLLVIQRFGPSRWGHISELTTENHSVSLHPINADGTLGKDGVDINFYPEDKVHSSWSLLGRATTVVGANRKREDSGGNFERSASEKNSEDIQQTQVKADEDSSGVKGGSGIGPPSDPAEAEAWYSYHRARDAYREAHGNMIKVHSLVLKVSWPETSRPAEWKIIGHIQTLGENDKFIKGHVPVAEYARDLDRYSTRHIRDFLGIKTDGTRTLRLIVMRRLRPIYDLDGKQFWDAFWQCVACHYRLWVNGIHHGDISYNNLMYDVSSVTGKPEGIINDFDLATWVDHSTTDNDRTGTIPFMAIDLLDGGLDDRIPRLYRHDAESFVWVLAYITVAEVEYENCTIKISVPPEINAWFKDSDSDDRKAHILSKRLLHSEYGYNLWVSDGHYCYYSAVQQMIRYWNDFHQSLWVIRHPPRYRRLGVLKPARGGPVPSRIEVDDPVKSLMLFITTVEKSFGEGDVGEGFAEVKALLLG